MNVVNWGALFGWAVCLFLVVAAVVIYRRQVQSRGSTPMVAMVRRRRELTERLNELAGASATELAQLEGKRRNTSSTSIEALEAAIARAERLSLRSAPQGGR